MRAGGCCCHFELPSGSDAAGNLAIKWAPEQRSAWTENEGCRLVLATGSDQAKVHLRMRTNGMSQGQLGDSAVKAGALWDSIIPTAIADDKWNPQAMLLAAHEALRSEYPEASAARAEEGGGAACSRQELWPRNWRETARPGSCTGEPAASRAAHSG